MMIVVSIIVSLLIIIIVLVLAFFISSEWILGLAGYLGITRWQAMKTLFSRVTGAQYPYVIVAEGKSAVVSKGNIMVPFGGPGLVIIRPFNAAVFEYGGVVKRIVGPGLYKTVLYENVSKTIDLRPQEGENTLIEVPTREGVSLTLTIRYRYQIETKDMEDERRRLSEKYKEKIVECKQQIEKLENTKKYLRRVTEEYHRLTAKKGGDIQGYAEKLEEYERRINKLRQIIEYGTRRVEICQSKLEEWKEIEMKIAPPPLFPGELSGMSNYSRNAIGRAVYNAQPEGWHVATEHAVTAAIYDQVGKLGLHEIFGDPENPFSATPGMLREIANGALFQVRMRTAQWGVCVTSIDVVSVVVPRSVQERISALWAAVSENDSFIRRTQGEVDRYRLFAGVQTTTTDRMLAIFNDAVQRAEENLPKEIMPVYISLLSRIAEEIGRDRISAYRYFQTLEAMSRNPNANIIVSTKDDPIIISASRKSLDGS